MERILAQRLATYLRQIKLFNESLQCGFQRNRNCFDVLYLYEFDIINQLEHKSEFSISVFTDFSKAYDTIWSDGLLVKLYNLGIDGKFLYFIRDFLKNRYTRVIGNNNTKSEWLKMFKGIPQGSPLSPLLYIIFTNDYERTRKNHIKKIQKWDHLQMI